MGEYTFETLVVGEFNKFGHSAAIKNMQGDVNFKTILIQAETGLGKTHFLKAMMNEAKDKKPQETQIYITCEDFVSEFINSIKNNHRRSFKKKYRSIQLFLIDDIQFISRKSATQEELSSILDWLYDHGAKIVFSSNSPISQIPYLSERFKSRLSGGLIVVIEKPEYEDRRKILVANLLKKNNTIPSDVIDYIAENVTSNIRDLEGALCTVLAYQALQNINVSIENVANLLNIGAKKVDNQIVLISNSIFGYESYTEQNISTLLLRISQIVKEGCKLSLYSVDSNKIDEATDKLDKIPNVKSIIQWL